MTSTSGVKTRGRAKKAKAGKALTLPGSTTTINLGGTAYYVTPVSDMEQWMEDMRDIVDSDKAMNEPGESIPFERVVKNLGLKLPPRGK